MLKDLHTLLKPKDAREFRKYVNGPDNFLKHAKRDPEGVINFEPRWTEFLLWEAGSRYCDMTGSKSKLIVAYALWFVAHHPEVKEKFLKDCAEQGINVPPRVFRLPLKDRRRFFALLS